MDTAPRQAGLRLHACQHWRLSQAVSAPESSSLLGPFLLLGLGPWKPLTWPVLLHRVVTQYEWHSPILTVVLPERGKARAGVGSGLPWVEVVVHPPHCPFSSPRTHRPHAPWPHHRLSSALVFIQDGLENYWPRGPPGQGGRSQGRQRKAKTLAWSRSCGLGSS